MNKAEKNPWAKETLNLTEQARILTENPNLAATLKAQAARSTAQNETVLITQRIRASSRRPPKKRISKRPF